MMKKKNTHLPPQTEVDPSRIGLVSIPYCSRIVPVSSFALPFFLLLSLFYHSRFQKRK